MSTASVTSAECARLGDVPNHLPRVLYIGRPAVPSPHYRRAPASDRRLVGVDIFVHARDVDPIALAASLQDRRSADFDGDVEVIKTEHLCNFDGEPGYALGQGQ